jgi:hypothetical protein
VLEARGFKPNFSVRQHSFAILLWSIQQQIAVNYQLLKRLYRKTLIVSVNCQTDKIIQKLYLLLNKHKKQVTKRLNLFPPPR